MLEIDKDSEFSWNVGTRKEDGTVAIVYTTPIKSNPNQTQDEK